MSQEAPPSPRASIAAIGRPSVAPLTGNLSPGRLSVMPQQSLTSVPAICTQTAQELDSIWDEVGYSSAEKNAQIGALVDTIKNFCEMKVAEEKAVKNQFQVSIDQTRIEIADTSRALSKEIPPSTFDDNTSATLTEVLSSLTEVAESLRASAASARSRISASRETILNSHAALGTEPPERFANQAADAEDLRENAVLEFERAAEDIALSVSTRMQTIVGLVLDCQNLLKELCIEADLSEFDRKVVGSLQTSKSGKNEMVSMVSTETCVGIGGSALSELTDRVGELNTEKKRRKIKLGELGAEIACLWEKLKIGEDVQREFTESVKGLGMDTLMKGEVEVARLLKLKSEMRGKLISEARETIVQLWSETNASQSVRDAFEGLKTMDEEDFTDELLQKHDDEIEVLQARLDQMRPMLRMIERREEVIAERTKYEELQKDPDRLKQRGGALTKQLMMEEKMSKRIKKDLPKYNDALSKKLKEWENECGEPFMFKGERYADIMSVQESEWRAYKDNEAAKKLQKKQQEKARYSGVGGKPKMMTKKKNPLGSSRQNSIS
ncbi:hypothetical protein TrCOL_g9137 [Triparma columacea]|uniref:Uncharacterized protein n=1 Tax=Triparma columacea TaxID=722753 RepID=A0A9W7GFB9_9STRA|nr:hypothetical protein TrCOL_g9137 [Triparma columacea]